MVEVQIISREWLVFLQEVQPMMAEQNQTLLHLELIFCLPFPALLELRHVGIWLMPVIATWAEQVWLHQSLPAQQPYCWNI